MAPATRHDLCSGITENRLCSETGGREFGTASSISSKSHPIKLSDRSADGRPKNSIPVGFECTRDIRNFNTHTLRFFQYEHDPMRHTPGTVSLKRLQLVSRDMSIKKKIDFRRCSVTSVVRSSVRIGLGYISTLEAVMRKRFPPIERYHKKKKRLH